MSSRILFSCVACLALLLPACASSKGKTVSEEGGEYAELTSPVARAKLQGRIDNIKYQRGVTLITNLEKIASYGEAAVQPCLDGLKSQDAMTRMGCAWVLGRVGDARTIPALTDALGDEVAFVRYEVASQLGNMGSKAGYPVLVQGLSDERVEYRYKCFEALRELTGQEFGYSHNASPEVRKVAVEQWDAWLTRLNSEEF